MTGCQCIELEFDHHAHIGPCPNMFRSMLFVPATNDKFIAKAAERGADAIILDLEDSIPPAQKANARAALAKANPLGRFIAPEEVAATVMWLPNATPSRAAAPSTRNRGRTSR